MVHIYVLELENNKYYIGKTSNINARIAAHFASDTRASAWTTKYKPIKVLQTIPDCDVYDEDKYVIQYMEKHGIHNVRGGSFCETVLSESNIITINQMIYGANDNCYKCGNKGHFARDCMIFNKPTPTPTPTPTLTNIKIVLNKNEKCDCITSYFSPHRKFKCALNHALKYLDDDSV